MPPSVESQPSTILLLEPDDDIRPLLKGNLEHWGYTVLTALNAENALVRATHDANIDLILINQYGVSLAAAIVTGQHIRQQSQRPNSTPIIVLAEEYTAEMEGRDVRMGGDSTFVAYLEDGRQLLNLIKSLLA